MSNTKIQLTKERFLKEVPGIKNFKHWFYLQNDGRYRVVVLDLVTFKDVAGSEEQILSESDILTSADLAHDFSLFMQRPEYCVGRVDIIESESNLALIYDKLLIGATLMRAREAKIADPDSFIDEVYRGLEWLHTTDFFDAPASSVYHESYPHGLLEHTIKVIVNACSLLSVRKFANVSLSSAVIIAATHDWCKIGNYEQYMKNVKNDSGKWEQVAAYRRIGEPHPLGHGVLSMFYASKFFRLSVEESAALRWHMGAWRVCKDELNELQSANEKYPLVHLIQFADQLSITDY